MKGLYGRVDDKSLTEVAKPKSEEPRSEWETLDSWCRRCLAIMGYNLGCDGEFRSYRYEAPVREQESEVS